MLFAPQLIIETKELGLVNLASFPYSRNHISGRKTASETSFEKTTSFGVYMRLTF